MPADADAGAVNTVPGVIEGITYLGDLSIYHVRIADGDEGLVKVAEPNFDRATNRPFTWGDAVTLSWPADAGVVLDS